MDNIEKKENINLSWSLTEDEKNLLIFDETVDNLISRISFYETDLTKKEKEELGRTITCRIVDLKVDREMKRKTKSWNQRVEAFKDAYRIQQKNKDSMTWLLSNVLGLSNEEAIRRYDMFQDIISHPEFKDKENLIIEKVYLNKNHLKSTELKDASLMGGLSNA